MNYFLRSSSEAMGNSEEIPTWVKALLQNQEAARIQQEETINKLLQTLANGQQQAASQPNLSAATEVHQQQQDLTNRNKIHAPARPPLLNSSITYSKFRPWREIWNDYSMLIKLDQFPLQVQKAEFRSCLSEDMRILLKCALDVQENDTSTIAQILDKIQNHLRMKRNVALDRVAFEQRKQEVGEAFDDFYVSIKQLAEEADLCDACRDQRLTTKIMASIVDQEMRQKLLALTPFPNLQSVVDMCRSQETALRDAATINGKVNIERVQRKKSNYQKQKWKKPENDAREKQLCGRCGHEKHPLAKCPAKDSACGNCHKTGHWGKMCRTSKGKNTTQAQAVVQTITIADVTATSFNKTPRVTLKCKIKIPGTINIFLQYRIQVPKQQFVD